MAAKKRWWKDGDHDEVAHYKPRSRFHELCPVCGQAYSAHGKLGKVLVHPGDYIVTHDGGEHSAVRPDPLAEAAKAVS